ncbi:hypothetical protein VTJ83DRAFT_1083 [Remersonia thermophila]|uniref:Pheromone receptor n=1 Tax=Remersonia thermophila TaxID=72144 RepID=A0ABR4DPS7_9PEZI
MASTNSTTLPPGPGRWDIYGFTTTPEERIGLGPPYTTPALQVNLFFRVFLGILAALIPWVPARLLWRNGEFAGTVMCVMLIINNLTTAISALIWRDDNVADWWAGYGWCDFQAYFYFALHTAFNISLFEIQRGLAQKVSLSRADKPSRREVRRQRIVSALIIFTVPIIQVILTYFATVSRYNVATLVGLAFYRYRKIDKATRDILRSSTGAAASKQNRVRMKLYFMTLVAIVIILPVIMVLLFAYIVEGAPWDLPYDFDAIHYGPDPFNMYFISFTTSDKLTFAQLNLAYLAIFGSFLVFVPFGTTPDALNMYRTMLLAVGLGYCFPKLREEYVPRSNHGSRFTWRAFFTYKSGTTKKSLGTSSSTSTRKSSLLPTIEQVSLASRCQPPSSTSPTTPSPNGGDLTSSDVDLVAVAYPEKSLSTLPSPPARTDCGRHNPWPDLSAAEIDAATAQITNPRPAAVGSSNPYAAILPSTYARPPKFPSLGILSHHRHSRDRSDAVREANEKNKPSSSSSTRPLNIAGGSSGNDDDDDAAAAAATAALSAGTEAVPTQEEERRPSKWWSPPAHDRGKMGVATRVWAAASGGGGGGGGGGGRVTRKGKGSKSKSWERETTGAGEMAREPGPSTSASGATPPAASASGPASAGVCVVRVETHIASHWSENPAAASGAGAAAVAAAEGEAGSSGVGVWGTERGRRERSEDVERTAGADEEESDKAGSGDDSGGKNGRSRREGIRTSTAAS